MGDRETGRDRNRRRGTRIERVRERKNNLPKKKRGMNRLEEMPKTKRKIDERQWKRETDKKHIVFPNEVTYT